MSFKINRSDSASPLLPNSAAPEARGPTKPKHPNIFGRSLFSKAPKNSSTSMAPRDNTPLLSAEQQAARSDGSTSGSKPWSMKSATSALSHAADKTQKALSGGAKLVSNSMHQAGKVMSNAYQAHNEPRYTRLPTDHSQEYQARPHTPPTARTEVRADAHLAENIRPPVNGRENGQGGRPQVVGPAPGRTPPLQPSSQPLATSRPAVHNAPSSGRHPPSAPAKTAERTPLGVHTGNVPQPAARPRPTAGGAENANPNVGRRSQHAVVRENLPAFTKIFKGGSMDRPLEPKQLVKAMVDVSKGARVEQDVHKEIARNPKWGQQMEQRWNTLRNSVADAREGGNAQVPSLENMLDKHPLAFMDFIANGSQKSFDKLMPPQTPAAPEVAAHAQSTKPPGRDDVRPQSPRTEHAVQRPGRNESKPADERTQLTATLRNLDQQIAASELKGKQILSRMFDPATIGPAVAAATRESYAHKAQHNELIAARNQVQAQLQRIGSGAAAGQPAGRPKVDPELEKAKATVAKGPPDLGKMYSTEIERVEHNNNITQNSTMIEPEDKHMEHVDFAAIEKKYAGKLARYNDAKKLVDAAANPERAQAQAAAFKEQVRTEAYSLAKQAYQSDLHDARVTVNMGPVTYDQVYAQARAEADQNYTTFGSQYLDHDAIVRNYEGINQRFEAAKQFLAKPPLTGEQIAAGIDAQMMAEAERRVRQRQ